MIDEAVAAAAAAAGFVVAAEQGAGSAHQRLVSSFPPGRQSREIWALWAMTRGTGVSVAIEENGSGTGRPGVIEQLRNLGQV